MLTVNHLTLSVRRQPLLREVAFSVAPGEVLTLCIRARLTDGALPEGAVPRLGFNERSDTGFLRALPAVAQPNDKVA